MPNDNVLTAEARATIMDACQSISRSADALKDCHTVDGDWGDELDAKAFYDAELNLLARLTALLTASPPPAQADAREGLTDEQRSTLESLARTSTPYEQEVLRSILAAHPGQPEPADCGETLPGEYTNADDLIASLREPEPRAEVTNPTSTVGRLLATAPHFEGCETPEPSLSAMIRRYYENYFERDEARECAARYIEALYRAGDAS